MISQPDNSGIPERCPDRRSTKLRRCRWGWRSWCFFNRRSFVSWCVCWSGDAASRSAASAVTARAATSITACAATSVTTVAVSAGADGTTTAAARSSHHIAARVTGAGAAAAGWSWCRAATMVVVPHWLTAPVPSTCFCRTGQQHGCQREDHSETSHYIIPSIELLPARNPTDELPQTSEKRFQTA